MVFLTSIDILDTGFLSKTTRTNQLSTSNRANSGNALRLKGVTFQITSSANLDKETSPSKTTGPEVSYISANARDFVLTLHIGSNNIDTNNVWGVNDMSLISELIQLPETRGFKAIYYPVASNIRKRNSQIVYHLGSADTSEPQGDIDITLATTEGDASGTSGYDLTDVNYIACRFESCDISQEGGDNGITITLNGVVTG